MYLAIQGGGVMSRPEDIKQRLKIALFGIILNPDNLCMVRCVRADILVWRIVEEPLGVSNLRMSHTGDSLKRQLHAPEASSGELCKLISRRRNVIIVSLSDSRKIHR